MRLSSSSTVRFATTAALSHASLLGAKNVTGVSSVSFSPACEQHQQWGHDSSSSYSMQKLWVNAPAAGNSAVVLNGTQGAASLVSFRPAHKHQHELLRCQDSNHTMHNRRAVVAMRHQQGMQTLLCKKQRWWLVMYPNICTYVHGARLPEARQH